MAEIEKKLNLISPWLDYVRKLREFWQHDTAVTIEYDEDANKVAMYVCGDDKADAIGDIMPAEMEFGGVTLTVEVVPADAVPTTADTLRQAFLGNPLVLDVVEVSEAGWQATYVIVDPDVIQYANDGLNSCFGVRTATVEDVAREILALPDGVFVCSARLVED